MIPGSLEKSLSEVTSVAPRHVPVAAIHRSFSSKASIALKDYVGTKDYTEQAFPGGHIGIYVSGRAHKEVPPSIGKWIDART